MCRICRWHTHLIIHHDKTIYLKYKKGKKDSDDISVTEEHLQVQSSKYLGSLANNNNRIEEEMKGRIRMENKALQMNAALLTN
jgi:hypothetical protein